MALNTHTDPIVIWQLRRENQTTHAMIVPHTRQTTLLWWVDDKIESAEYFIEWDGALERAEVVRDRFVREGWTDVT
jgi:hypothetical protein